MRFWHFWWQTVMLSSQHNPAKFIELLMLLLALALAGIWVFNQTQWPYLVLCASYVVGVAASICADEAIAPSSRERQVGAVMALLLAVLFAIFSIVHLMLAANYQ